MELQDGISTAGEIAVSSQSIESRNTGNTNDTNTGCFAGKVMRYIEVQKILSFSITSNMQW